MKSKIDFLNKKIDRQDHLIYQLYQSLNSMQRAEQVSLPILIDVPSTTDLAFHNSE